MAKGQRSLICRFIVINAVVLQQKKGFSLLGMETIRRHRRNCESKFIFDSLFSATHVTSSQSLL